MKIFYFVGYRDAECGWVVVEEEEEDDFESSKEDGKPSKRRALFCVIYAPKRGILEVNEGTVQRSLCCTHFYYSFFFHSFRGKLFCFFLNPLTYIIFLNDNE